MCELPFCVVMCCDHRIYHCHLMKPGSWIIGASRINSKVVLVIGDVRIMSRTVHRLHPMSSCMSWVGASDVLRSPA
jgi:hypothetical protein